MTRRKAPAIPDSVLDQLLAGAEAKDAFGQDGLLDALKKALAERALNAELDHHLAAGEPDKRANSRNGFGSRTVLTDTGKIALEIPRDRLAVGYQKVVHFGADRPEDCAAVTFRPTDGATLCSHAKVLMPKFSCQSSLGCILRLDRDRQGFTAGAFSPKSGLRFFVSKMRQIQHFDHFRGSSIPENDRGGQAFGLVVDKLSPFAIVLL